MMVDFLEPWSVSDWSNTLMSRKYLPNNNLEEQLFLKKLIPFPGYVYVCVQLYYFVEMYKGMSSDERFHI